MVGFPLAFGMIGKAGRSKWMRDSASRTGWTAELISGEWKAPATGRRIAFPPRLRASSSARSTAVNEPDSTVCFGEFSLATARTSPRPATSHTSIASRSDNPTIAVIAPGFSKDAFSIAVARAASAASPGSSATAPEATSAAYSPKEWPAATLQPTPSAFNTSNAARSQANTVSCTVSVRFRALGSRLVSTTSQPTMAEHRSRISLPTGWPCHGSAIPGYCDPWPGNRVAICIAVRLVLSGAHGGSTGGTELAPHARRSGARPWILGHGPALEGYGAHPSPAPPVDSNGDPTRIVEWRMTNLGCQEGPASCRKARCAKAGFRASLRSPPRNPKA